MSEDFPDMNWEGDLPKPPAVSEGPPPKTPGAAPLAYEGVLRPTSTMDLKDPDEVLATTPIAIKEEPPEEPIPEPAAIPTEPPSITPEIPHISAGMPQEPETVAYKPPEQPTQDEWGEDLPPEEPPPKREPQLSKGLPTEPETVAYRPPAAPEPEPWEGPKPPPTLEGTSEARPGAKPLTEKGVLDSINFEGADKLLDKTPSVLKEEEPELEDAIVYDEDGNREEGWKFVRESDTGAVVIHREVEGKGSHTRFVPKEKYEEWKKKAETEAVVEGSAPTEAAKATKEAKIEPESELSKILKEAQDAAAKGDSEAYVKATLRLLEMLKKTAKEHGIPEDAVGKVEEKLAPKNLEQRIKEAAKRMSDMANINKLRQEWKKKAKTGDKAELLDEYLEVGTPYEASESIKKLVGSMLELDDEEFELFKASLGEKEEEKEKGFSGELELDPDKRYYVMRSDGSGTFMEADFKKLIIKNGRIEKVVVEVEQEIKNPRPDANETEAGTIKVRDTREIPIAQFMKWQEAAKEAGLPQDGKTKEAKKAEEPTEEEKTSAKATEEEKAAVDPEDPEKLSEEAKKRVQRRLEILKRLRAGEFGPQDIEAVMVLIDKENAKDLLDEEKMKKRAAEATKEEDRSRKRRRQEAEMDTARKIVSETIGKIFAQRLLRREVLREKQAAADAAAIPSRDLREPNPEVIDMGTRRPTTASAEPASGAEAA